jgi:calcium/calmodulin-dependent protein kinase I
MATMSYQNPQEVQQAKAQVAAQPCRYKTGKTLGAGSYSVVKECVHIDTGRYYAAKVINKRLMAGREHMVSSLPTAILSPNCYSLSQLRLTARPGPE